MRNRKQQEAIMQHENQTFATGRQSAGFYRFCDPVKSGVRQWGRSIGGKALLAFSERKRRLLV